MKASNTEVGGEDQFGYSAAVSGNTLVAGAPQNDNSASDAGAAYVFTPLPTTLGNISTRLRIETGDNVLIGGFIITGTQMKKVLVRAIGPSLPLICALVDPTLELHDGAGALLTSNNNWMDAPNIQEIIDSTIAPTKRSRVRHSDES